TFEANLRRNLDAELGALFRLFLQDAAVAERTYIRDLLKHHSEGEGIRTAALCAEGEREKVYLIVPRAHFEMMGAFLARLAAGSVNFEPIGAGWALWKRPGDKKSG